MAYTLSDNQVFKFLVINPSPFYDVDVSHSVYSQLFYIMWFKLLILHLSMMLMCPILYIHNYFTSCGSSYLTHKEIQIIFLSRPTCTWITRNVS